MEPEIKVLEKDNVKTSGGVQKRIFQRSMYGIFSYIYDKHQPNANTRIIHGIAHLP